MSMEKFEKLVDEGQIIFDKKTKELSELFIRKSEETEG